jgi:hypothetical protein
VSDIQGDVQVGDLQRLGYGKGNLESAHVFVGDNLVARAIGGDDGSP